MVDVSLRDKRGQRAQRTRSRYPRWTAPLAIAAGAITLLAVAGVVFHLALNAYRERMALTGLTSDPKPVGLTIAGERLFVPANMLRFAATRHGGPVERAELILHWPSLTGYSDARADAFTGNRPGAPLIFATIAPRESMLDSTERLDDVYALFFVGKALAGPAGLVGRTLSADSGYGEEIVYFVPDQPQPFVTRCLAEDTPALPSTCLRDIKVGRKLTLTYRFNRTMLGHWPAIDAGMRGLADSFLAR